MSVRIINADVMDGLRQLPDESVHCVVTSPPYWGLRDYGVAGQLGLEPSLGEHIDALVDVFREVRRVLRKDGTVWLNYGDAYACTPNGRSAADTKAAGSDDRTFRDKPISTVGPVRTSFRRDRAEVLPAALYDADHEKGDRRGGPCKQRTHDGMAAHTGRIVAGGVMKPKDRMLLPARIAIALCDDGWWLRDEIIWHKPNPMPSSVRDRTTPAHEMVYLLSKSPRYYFDQAAIAEPATSHHASGNGYRRPERLSYADANGARGNEAQWTDLGGSRNKRSVWTIGTEPFSEAHFATFPTELIKPMILAGCPVGGTVLDPFGGSGTVGLVADRHHRNAILVDLNADYCALARARVSRDAPMFTEVTAA